MSAVISPCGLYRYRLERHFRPGHGRSVAFIGVNPSTADATTDDATVRKWIGFARRWDFDRIVVVNLFAYRSTDVRSLALQLDPVGPDNDGHVADVIAAADLVVPCWGSHTKLPGRLQHRTQDVHGLIVRSGRAAKCLGRTASGDPRHPLMLGYDTPLVDYP